MNEQVLIVVRGRVQGVSFRAYTRQTARSLGLTGTVRNLTDGGVEIVAVGVRERLDRLVEWARRGPSLAQVTDVAVTFEPISEARNDFVIMP